MKNKEKCSSESSLLRERQTEEIESESDEQAYSEELLEKIQDDFEKTTFFKCMKSAYRYSSKEAQDNKQNYFDYQEKASHYKAVKSMFEAIYNQKVVITTILGMFGTYIIQVISNSTAWEMIVILGIMIILGIAGFIYIQALRYEREIAVREYGETWVRHEAMVYNINREMLKYIENLGEYCGEEESEKKKIFQENILSILDKNEEKFQENMKDIK